MQFTKVVHFTRLIKAGGRLREFNFRKLKAMDEDVFSVDTVDDRGNRIVLRMQKTPSGHWGLSQRELPTWILENEEKFTGEIEEELLRQ